MVAMTQKTNAVAECRSAGIKVVDIYFDIGNLLLFFLSESLIQLDTGIQYFGRHDKKFGDFFKTALNRATPGLHEFT